MMDIYDLYFIDFSCFYVQCPTTLSNYSEDIKRFILNAYLIPDRLTFGLLNIAFEEKIIYVNVAKPANITLPVKY